MRAADELHRVTAELFVWQLYEPSVKAELTACAVLEAGELILIDPLPLAAEALEELTGHGRPSTVVLTNGNHGRATELYRKKFGVRVLASAGAAAELETKPDELVEEGMLVGGGLAVHSLEGAGPGEIALLGKSGGLHFGDAVIHLPEHGFSLLPEKYCTDARQMRESLRKLLRLDFTLLTFAHGLPIVTRARDQLAQLLA